ncbi:hypothetical protein C0991_003589 [Blastosporella zonata]|nr:hypothetical protein C0991_003589 [Blastosporella zonata]
MYWKWLLYTILGFLADALDTVWTSIQPVKMPQRIMRGSEIDGLTDAEIIQLFELAPLLNKESNARKLDMDIVVKPFEPFTKEGLDASDMAEVHVANLVLSKTSIPIPRVRRVIEVDEDFILIATDYIPGQTLAKLWPSLPLWRKFAIAFTLRRYVRQLRRLQAGPGTPPGLLSTKCAKLTRSPVWQKGWGIQGPFDSYKKLSTFMNKGYRLSTNSPDIPLDSPIRGEKFDDSQPLVLTHQDLHLGNIILGTDGRLWVIDWEIAGYYPEWFEYCAMMVQNDIGAPMRDDKVLGALIPFICGPYFKQRAFVFRMGVFLYRRQIS